MEVLSKIWKFFTDEPNYEIRNRAFDENVRVMRTLTFVFTIVEVIALAIFVVHGNGLYLKQYSVISASIGLSINLLYFIFSKFTEKKT